MPYRGLTACSGFLECKSLLVGAACLCFLLAGCGTEDAPSSYVARVGDHYLTQAEFRRLLPGDASVDSSHAREQIINQWVNRMLLLREAERLNLAQSPKVQRELDRQRQAVLVRAMTERLQRQIDAEPTDREVRAYFEQHREQFRLQRPHLQVRYVSVSSPDTAAALLQRARRAGGNVPWDRILRQSGIDTAATSPVEMVHPPARLQTLLPVTTDDLGALQEGEVRRFEDASGQIYLLRLVRRLPEGTPPNLPWVETEIRRRLRSRARKQIYTRGVERLRNRARVDDAIEIP